MKSEKVHGLYLLQGATIEGEVCVGVDSSYDLDVIRL